MTCEEFLKALDEERLETEPSYTAHAQACEDCRAALARWEAVRKQFAAMGEEPAPPFLHTRIMAHVNAAEPEGRPFAFLSVLLSRNRWAASLAALFIGALLGGAGIWQILKPRSSTTPLPPPEARSVESLPLEEAQRKSAEMPEPRETRDEAPAAKNAGGPAAPAAVPPAGSLFQRSGDAPAAPSQPSEAAADLPVGELRMKGAAHPGAPGPSRAPDQPTNEPVGQEREALAASPRPDAPPDEARQAVVCMIRPEGGGATKVIQIGADIAPPPGAPWTMVVQGGGAFYLLDANDKPLRPDMRLVNELAGLNLPPGRYALRRVG